MASIPPRPLAPRPQAARDFNADDPIAASRAKLVEFEKKLQIDRGDLDEELVNYSERYFHTGREHAYAKSYLEQAKAAVKTVRAECEIRIRNAAATSTTRVTDAFVEAQVSVDPQVAAATKRLHDWVFLEVAWMTLTIAVFERKGSIEGLIRLVSAQYYDPSIKGDGRTVGDAIAARVRNSGSTDA